MVPQHYSIYTPSRCLSSSSFQSPTYIFLFIYLYNSLYCAVYLYFYILYSCILLCLFMQLCCKAHSWLSFFIFLVNLISNRHISTSSKVFSVQFLTLWCNMDQDLNVTNNQGSAEGKVDPSYALVFFACMNSHEKSGKQVNSPRKVKYNSSNRLIPYPCSAVSLGSFYT